MRREDLVAMRASWSTGAALPTTWAAKANEHRYPREEGRGGHGIPIAEFCDEQRLDARQRLEVFVEVCSAINHAHQKWDHPS